MVYYWIMLKRAQKIEFMGRPLKERLEVTEEVQPGEFRMRDLEQDFDQLVEKDV